MQPAISILAVSRLYWIAAVLSVVTLQLTPNSARAADGPIVVGRTFALSGPLQSYGEAKRDGGDAYIRKVNAAGGIGGRSIELVTLDDAYTPANAVANIKSIAADRKPVAFLGLFGVPPVAAALPVLAELKIPAVGFSSGTDELRTPLNRYAFPVRASYADESRKLVSHVMVTGVSKLSVIYTDNPFGLAVKNTLMAGLKEAGLTATDFKVDATGKGAAEAANSAAAAQPQAIFLAMASPAAVPVLIELKHTSFHGATYTFSTVDGSIVTKKLGAGAHGLAITQVVPIPRGIRIKVVAEYVQALQDLGRGTPSFYGLEAFIEAKVLVEGLKRAGLNVSPASLVTSLETLHEVDVGGYFVSYRPDAHTGSRFVEIDMVDDSGSMIR